MYRTLLVALITVLSFFLTAGKEVSAQRMVAGDGTVIITVYPTDPGTGVAYAKTDVPGTWILFSIKENQLFPAPVEIFLDGKLVIVTGAPGNYGGFFTPAGEGQQPKVVNLEIPKLDIVEPSPPEPPNPPNPPEPPNPIGNAPFEAPGFAVLILYEMSELTKLPSTQVSIAQSDKIHRYLQDNVVRLNGKFPYFYRIWDDDFDQDKFYATDSRLTDAYFKVKQDAQDLPWIAIVDKTGKGGYTGPLPETVDETLALLKKYGD